MITLLLVAAALAWLFWPKGTPLPSPPQIVNGAWFPAATAPPPPPPQAPPAPLPPEFPSLNERDAERDADPRPAIDRLLVVRAKLAADGRLNDANGKAVDQLMLELVHGRQLPDPKELP